MPEKNIKADLHIHTDYSDGKYSILDVINFAHLQKIKIVSVTDHDCICGIDIAVEHCNKLGIKFIPGIEFSTDFNGNEIHILGYGIDYENEDLKVVLETQNEKRLTRFKNIITNLNSIGFKIEFSEFLDSFPSSKALGRMHIAEMMKRKKYVKSIAEAFYKYIGDFGIANERKINYSTMEIIELIRRINGISILAHPEKNSAKESIKDLIKLGVDGIEIIHPSHNKSKVEYYRNYADSFRLLKTGGSDFHGTSNQEIKNFGKYYIEIDYDIFEKFFIN
ncbi:MAG: PHP domain-containing protein [Ignavibacteria bacterium]|nr:PHP domain-containing protein [Ignavibacteria bacterium]